MKITLGDIDFQIAPVKERIRDAILADPIINQVIWRDVYRWDHQAEKGEVLVQVAESGAVPLPNGVVFFVPKPGTSEKSDNSSRNMSKRVLAGVGANSVTDLVRALHKILHMPQKVLPLEVFSPLNAAASYVLRMHTEFNVVEMKNAERNMSFYVIIPGQVAFHHELTGKDDAAFDALIADTPDLRNPQPQFLIPAHSKANQAIRALALSKRVEELQLALKAKAAAGDKGTPAQQHAFRMAIGELKLLTKKKAA